MAALGRDALVASLFDGSDYLRVSGASAKITAHVFLNISIRFGMPFPNTSDGRHNLTRRAIAALKAVLVDECLLHRVQFAIAPRKPLNGFDTLALRRDGQSQTRKHSLTVNVNRARAALT